MNYPRSTPAERRSSRIRRALQSGAILLFSFALSFALLEVAARRLLPQFDPRGSRFVTTLSDGTPIGVKNFIGRQWKNTGDFDVGVQINEDGFRDTKDIRTATPEDLFVIGDSYSFGWGVEEDERYSSRLEQMSRSRVFNLAIPSGNLDDYGRLLDYARSLGAPIRRVVVGVCMENDLAFYGQPVAPVAKLSPLQRVLGPLKAELAGNSTAYQALTTMVHGSSGLKGFLTSVGLIQDARTDFYMYPNDPALIESTAERLIALTEGLDATILIIPSRAMFTDNAAEQENARRIHEAFIEALRGLTEAEVVDILPEILPDPAAYHFRYDGHWNREGHRVAAEALYGTMFSPAGQSARLDSSF